MAKIELSTLGAEIESTWDDSGEGERIEVVLKFGTVEVARWLVPDSESYYLSGVVDEDRRRAELEQFVAGKLAELFKGA
jgi:hypothetical protein